MRIHLQEAAVLNRPECHPDKASFNALCHSFALTQASISRHDTKSEDLFGTGPIAKDLLLFLALARVDNDATCCADGRARGHRSACKCQSSLVCRRPYENEVKWFDS
jgi:hypothetical protein